MVIRVNTILKNIFILFSARAKKKMHIIPTEATNATQKLLEKDIISALEKKEHAKNAIYVFFVIFEKPVFSIFLKI